MLPDPSAYIDSGEKELKHAIPWSQITPAPFDDVAAHLRHEDARREERRARREAADAVEDRDGDGAAPRAPQRHEGAAARRPRGRSAAPIRRPRSRRRRPTSKKAAPMFTVKPLVGVAGRRRRARRRQAGHEARRPRDEVEGQPRASDPWVDESLNILNDMTRQVTRVDVRGAPSGRVTSDEKSVRSACVLRGARPSLPHEAPPRRGRSLASASAAAPSRHRDPEARVRAVVVAAGDEPRRVPRRARRRRRDGASALARRRRDVARRSIASLGELTRVAIVELDRRDSTRTGSSAGISTTDAVDAGRAVRRASRPIARGASIRTNATFIAFDAVENAIAVEGSGGWVQSKLPQPSPTETQPYVRDIESNGQTLLAAAVWGIHRSTRRRRDVAARHHREAGQRPRPARARRQPVRARRRHDDVRVRRAGQRRRHAAEPRRRRQRHRDASARTARSCRAAS